MYIAIAEQTPDYLTINLYDKHNNYFFGFLDISIYQDCYTISGKVNHFERYEEIELFETRKKKLRTLFSDLKLMLINGTIPLKLDRPVLILADELISKDAIKYMELKKIARYNGYLFI